MGCLRASIIEVLTNELRCSRMRVAPPIELTQQDQQILSAWANGRKTPVRLAERAKIVLLAAEGRQDVEIAVAHSITPKKPAVGESAF